MYMYLQATYLHTQSTARQKGGGKQVIISTTAAKPYSLAVLRKQNPFYVLIIIYFMEKNDCFPVQTKNTVFGLFF